jgi:hypothetical protein
LILRGQNMDRWSYRQAGSFFKGNIVSVRVIGW